jgi:hypothetical protein
MMVLFSFLPPFRNKKGNIDSVKGQGFSLYQTVSPSPRGKELETGLSKASGGQSVKYRGRRNLHHFIVSLFQDVSLLCPGAGSI